MTHNLNLGVNWISKIEKKLEIFPTGKMSLCLGKNYTIDVFKHNIVELFIINRYLLKSAITFFKMSQKSHSCHFISKIAPNMIIFPIGLH